MFQTVATGSLPWNEDGIELDYSKKFHTCLLVPLRDFIQDGINFTVIKTKHMYVLEDPNAPQTTETKLTASAKSKTNFMYFGKNPTVLLRKLTNCIHHFTDTLQLDQSQHACTCLFPCAVRQAWTAILSLLGLVSMVQPQKSRGKLEELWTPAPHNIWKPGADLEGAWGSYTPFFSSKAWTFDHKCYQNAVNNISTRGRGEQGLVLLPQYPQFPLSESSGSGPGNYGSCSWQVFLCASACQ